MSTVARVASAFNKAFAVPVESITAQTIPDDVPKWDSVGHMNLVSALEEEFGVQFEVDEIMSMATVAIILDVLATKDIRD